MNRGIISWNFPGPALRSGMETGFPENAKPRVIQDLKKPLFPGRRRREQEDRQVFYPFFTDLFQKFPAVHRFHPGFLP